MDNVRCERLTPTAVSRFPRRRALGLLSGLGLGFGTLPLRKDVSAARQATVTPTLLVRGETEIAASASLAWRVVRDVAEVSSAAIFEERALGFAVASGPFSELLLTDQATGSSWRLAPGEAAFVREGTFQRRESLGESAQSYLRIGLVDASAAGDAGGDWMVFAGPAFAAPTGPVTLALHRVALEDGETSYVAPRVAAALVLLEQGELELEQGEAAPRELLQTVVGSDTSYAVRSLSGGTTLFGTRDATSVLIATFA